uniref:Uncharacterized protein n=1 Tax=Micrurus lemniscatus lemniscatus TaxID=129467 RepID=A0A2D4I9N3_MICLE
MHFLHVIYSPPGKNHSAGIARKSASQIETTVHEETPHPQPMNFRVSWTGEGKICNRNKLFFKYISVSCLDLTCATILWLIVILASSCACLPTTSCKIML